MSEKKRRYELKQRAERREQTRQRITEVTLELHEEVGPARTTIAEIAARAGVSRPTVYNQFPDDLSLFAACSAHFASLHPAPKLSGLALEEALAAQYGFYKANQRVLANVYRDAETLPSLAQVLGVARAHIAESAAELAGTLGVSGTRLRQARAALALALDFHTWRNLDRSGLTAAEGAKLMTRLIRSV